MAYTIISIISLIFYHIYVILYELGCWAVLIGTGVPISLYTDMLQYYQFSKYSFTHYYLCTHLKRIQLDVLSKCAQLPASATDKVARWRVRGECGAIRKWKKR
eukprot:SAG22_NODE_201_length_15391_cov_7.662176_6_plen_103_part_00